jgi:hypothetical protein
MGYKVKRRTVKFVFPEGSDLHGIEITIKMPKLESIIGSEVSNRELFFKCLESWNLEDEEGNALPPRWEGGADQMELQDWRDILSAFMDRVSGKVSDPLPAPSADSEQSDLELSLPMESL